MNIWYNPILLRLCFMFATRLTARIFFDVGSSAWTSVLARLYLIKLAPYSGTGAMSFGYRDTSFSLTLPVVKCQQMLAPAWLRSISHAASSCRSPSMSPILRERHCRVITLSAISAMFSQLPCFGA